MGTREQRIHLKIEGHKTYGSIKDRTATALLHSARSRPGGNVRHVVESTSGNLGVALAGIGTELDIDVTLVIDPRVPRRAIQRMRELGARLDMVEDPDSNGGYLLTRLNRVQALLREDSRLVWTDQYSNPANPAVHERETAPELAAQIGDDLDAVFVPVSTGGTLAGMASWFRRHRPHVTLIAVDAQGSVALGAPAGTRELTGIGASRPSRFLEPWSYDAACIVPDALAFTVARALREATGLALGGSSGAALAACVTQVAAGARFVAPVCVCPDSGDNYEDTFYHDAWLRARNIVPQHDALTLPGGLGTVEFALL